MSNEQMLREALQVARDHIDMDALEISHCKDAALIREALALPDVPETNFGKMREALRIIKDTLPHVGGSASSIHSLTQIAEQALALPTAAPVGDLPERETFEKSMITKHGWAPRDFRQDDFGYFDGHTATAWLAWQARAAMAGDARDAARYRWLADCNNYYEAIKLIADGTLTEDALGKAIDQAMARGGELE